MTDDTERYPKTSDPFQPHELVSYLGDYVDEYDFDAIVGDVTWVDHRSGNRYWLDVPGDDFGEIVEGHRVADE
jgi:hypothetical protein